MLLINSLFIRPPNLSAGLTRIYLPLWYLFVVAIPVRLDSTIATLLHWLFIILLGPLVAHL